MNKLYFDYAATTPCDEDILEVFKNVNMKYYTNNMFDDNSRITKEAESKINEMLGVKDYDVIFTSGGTEANNLGVLGKFEGSKGKHFITSKIEHPSVLEVFKYLEEIGNEVTYLDIKPNGDIDLEYVKSIIKDNTVMVCVMGVNNEIGCVINVNELFKIVKDTNEEIITMTDAVQALGKVKVSMDYVDEITFSAHKIYGLKGIGVLVKKKNINLTPLIHSSKGSDRPGTYPISSVVTFINAFVKCLNDFEDNSEIIRQNTNYLCQQLEKRDVNINSENDIGIVSVTFNGHALGETIGKYLYDNGIVVSTKAACSAKANKRSHVLESIGLSNEKIDKTIRISMSHKTKKDDIDILVQKIDTIIEKFG